MELYSPSIILQISDRDQYVDMLHLEASTGKVADVPNKSRFFEGEETILDIHGPSFRGTLLMRQ